MSKVPATYSRQRVPMEENNEIHLEFREPDGEAEVHTARSWRGVSVQFSRLKLPIEYEFRWDGATHYLAHHDLILVDGAMEVLGEKPVGGGDLRDQLTFVPTGRAIDGWAKPADRLNAFTVVCFDPSAMEEELQAEFGGSEPKPHIYFKDEELGATMRKLGRLMADSEGPAAKVYAETVGLTAALEMFRLDQAATAKAPLSGKLSQLQIRLLQDYIEENFASDVGLDDLAAVAGLTRFHFSRAFKTTFNETPYQYLIRRRVDRAKRLLAETRLAMSDIADACGFNGASQFGRTFKDIVGQTPLEFRRRA